MARHLLAMVLAMLAGMLLLGPARGALAGALGLAPATPGVAALLMATDMSVGMAVWMWYRGHSAPAIGEMTAAMYLPVLLLLPPYAVGLLGADALLTGGHLLMIPAMVGAMLWRRAEYAHHHAARPAADARPLVRVLAHRWPTGLALLMSFDNWFTPAVLPPWTLLGLAVSYPLVGAWRGRLGDRRVRAVQLAGLLGWTGLAVAALALGGDAAGWLVAVGWLAHAVWDAVHHRRDEVVPRGYAEWCAVLDTVLGVTMILFLLTTP
ncbi:hypothetical protein D7223_26300 [Micromonospora endolithica]|uniref:Uncharacterized protein n=1 Tax=Micromonospora endolithica TaxID=230091 RepID=A0A3A9YY73_9ACTN|nr:hypothetical protein D7223_26300 [Micromonospora endolithica]